MSEEEDLEKVLKEIGEAWKETKEHFGDEFPFEDNLKFKIIEKKVVEEGEIQLKEKEADQE